MLETNGRNQKLILTTFISIANQSTGLTAIAPIWVYAAVERAI